MKKPLIKNYREKMEWFIVFQNYSCSSCGRKMVDWFESDGYYYYNDYIPKDDGSSNFIKTVIKIDFAHNLPRKDNYIKDYPLFIDSILDASAQCHKCNYERKQPVKDNPDKMFKLYIDYQFHIDKINPIQGYMTFTESNIINIYKEFYCQGFTYAVAAQIEQFLQNNPEFARFVNMDN